MHLNAEDFVMSTTITSETIPLFRSLLATVAAMALLLTTGCSNSGNPQEVAPLVTEPKNGPITIPENWDDPAKNYRITTDCLIVSEVVWKSGITVTVDSAAVIAVANNGILLIESGVTIRLGTDAFISVGAQSPGSLIAEGTAGSPVTFAAREGTNSWGHYSDLQHSGIVFGDSARNCRMNFCTISDATTGIYAVAEAPSVTNCIIQSCRENGIYLDSSVTSLSTATFTGNSILNCAGYPLTLPASLLGNLSDGNDISGTANSSMNAIRVLGTSVEDSAAVWRKMGLPYYFTGRTIISSFKRVSSVTIPPGVTCSFDTSAFITIGDPRFGSGKLLAKGTAVDSIFFINSTTAPFWGDSLGGILIGFESPTQTKFEYCSFKNATSALYINIMVNATIMHCRVSGCSADGITFAGGTPLDSRSFIENVCTGNLGYGISITADKLANLSGTGSFIGNGKGGIHVSGAEIWESGTWEKHDAPYIIEGIIDIGSSDGVTITISPGATLQFLPGSYLQIGHADLGTLIAAGSADAPIHFTSALTGTFWGFDATGSTSGGIRIGQFADAATALTACTITNATSGLLVNAPVTIQNCSILNNQQYGLIYGKRADTTLFSGNVFAGNGVDAIYTIP